MSPSDPTAPDARENDVEAVGDPTDEHNDDPRDQLTDELTADLGPLDPAVEARITALLAAAPPAGPMPTDVSERLTDALAREADLRVDRAPTAAGSGASVTPLFRQPRERRPWIAVAAVAAAAAIVAVGGSALHLTKRTDGAAVIGDGRVTGSAGPTASTPTTSTPPGTPTVHIQVSTTNYTERTFVPQATTLLQSPGPTLDPLAAEAPAIGPIGTVTGLESCLTGLGVDAAGLMAVSTDIANWQGAPAAVVVVTQDGARRAWAVERSCSRDAPGLLSGPTDLP
ncbi:hypothetical protein DFJ68_3127 [Terracoccus luteus]|uniref:Uncharacterized protein n=1 Tax=Terracoccus luteus TaxID=53356 RepID=A0A495Y3H3_9MICO|nr:hypothetical protein [Terracoccus luteus]RKT79653.1 hypothetical protein DFJ68_3127 [Terracoccus luteus]